jgi:hypothetical protein
MSLGKLARNDMPPLTARTGKEAIAALKAAVYSRNQRLAAQQRNFGDQLNAGRSFQDVARSEDRDDGIGPFPVLGALVRRDAVVLVNAVLETEHEYRRRTGTPMLAHPTTPEEFRAWELQLDYAAAEFSLGQQIVGYYVALTPFPDPLAYAPLVTGAELTEAELEAALNAKVTHGYAWCFPAPTFEEDED